MSTGASAYQLTQLNAELYRLATNGGDSEAVFQCLDRGAQIEFRHMADLENRTSLMLAAANGHLSVVQALLDRGACIEAHCDDGWTALWWAIHEKRMDVATLLLDRGSDIERRGVNGFSILMHAATYGNVGAVQLLLDRGADLDVIAEGDTAESMAQLYRHAGVADLIRAERARRALLSTQGEGCDTHDCHASFGTSPHG